MSAHIVKAYDVLRLFFSDLFILPSHQTTAERKTHRTAYFVLRHVTLRACSVAALCGLCRGLGAMLALVRPLFV